MRNNVVGAGILGFVLVDVLGVPFESIQRGRFRCDGLTSGGTHRQPLGTWSDDTSMMLATMDSIIKNSGHIDPDDMMRRFWMWYNDDMYTATEECFDIGVTTRKALEEYDSSGDFRKCGQTGIEANGNGALMRMLPLAFLECSDADVDVVSSLTHAHEISMTGCRGFVSSTRELLRSGTLKTDGFSGDYQRLSHIEELGVSDIRSSGFVVDTLEAAFWCVKTTDNYRDCVLKAVNLGGDTDTIAAIAGGIAGIMYGIGGERGIPEEWISCILKRDWIEGLCDSFQKFCFVGE